MAAFRRSRGPRKVPRRHGAELGMEPLQRGDRQDFPASMVPGDEGEGVSRFLGGAPSAAAASPIVARERQC